MTMPPTIDASGDGLAPGAGEGAAVDALIASSEHALSSGDHLRGAALAKRAAEAAEALHDVRRVGEARAQLALHQTRLGEFDLAVVEGRQALSVFESIGDRSAQSRVHSTLAFALHNAQLLEDALAHAEAALACARSAEDSRAEVWALTRLAMICGTLGDGDRAGECEVRAVTLARRLALPEELFATLHNRANSIDRMGRDAAPVAPIDPTRIVRGLADSTEAIRLARQSANPHREAVALSTAGVLLMRLHRHEEARVHLERALALASAGGYRGPLAVTRIRWARVMEALGRHDEAMQAYARVLDDPAADAESTLEAHRARHFAWRSAGLHEQALDEFEKAHRLQVSLIESRNVRRMQVLAMMSDADRERDLAEITRRDSELQKMRADEARQLAERVSSERDKFEALVEQRTTELARARDDAEGAKRAQSAFLRSVSHELRTPLNGVIGMTTLAQRRATDPVQTEFLRNAITSAEHLRDLIDAVMDMIELESGRVGVRSEDFEPRRLLDEVLQLRRPAAAAKRLDLRGVIAPNVPTWLHGDAVSMRKILLCYVDNAVKFSEQGTIVVRLFVADQEAAALRLKFEVSDEGPGLKKELRNRVFDPFTQADDSPSRAHGGLGLGLSLARGLARRLGGDAGVVSEAGHGSTFWATAMAQRCASPALTADAADTQAVEREIAQRFGGARLVLADDIAIDQLVIAGLLTDLGLLVDVVESGAACVEAVVARPPALVLMALTLPDMDGSEAARAIALRLGDERPAIVALASLGENLGDTAPHHSGFDDCVDKPVDWDRLSSRVLHWLEQSLSERKNDPTSAPPSA